MSEVLANLSEASRLLAECTTIPEVKHYHDIAEAARSYALMAGLGLEAQNHATEVKLRAERKMGEMLKDRPTTSTWEGTSRPLPPEITRKQSSRWQTVAKLPEEEFEEYLATTKGKGEELTSAGVARLVTIDERKTKEQKRESERKTDFQKAAAVGELPEGVFSTILIDPPWDWVETDHDQFGRARPRYATMTVEELKKLPINKYSDTNAHLYLWITNRILSRGFDLIETWGFRYITCLTWCKPSFGMGNYFRGSTEHILFAVKGSLPLLRHDVGTWFEYPRGPKGHSSKPLEFYDLIESCSPGPYLEMFARQSRSGWESWGTDAKQFI